jgi:hypothetical protein
MAFVALFEDRDILEAQFLMQLCLQNFIRVKMGNDRKFKRGAEQANQT